MDLSLVDFVKQSFPITTLSNALNPINSTSFTFAKHLSPTFNSLRFTNRFKSSTVNSPSLQQSDSTSSTSILALADIQSRVFLMIASLTIGFFISFTKSIRIEEIPSVRILSTESFTNGCYSSLYQHNTHFHQLIHTPSLLHILHQALVHKVHKLSGPLGGGQRR